MHHISLAIPLKACDVTQSPALANALDANLAVTKILGRVIRATMEETMRGPSFAYASIPGGGDNEMFAILKTVTSVSKPSNGSRNESEYQVEPACQYHGRSFNEGFHRH